MAPAPLQVQQLRVQPIKRPTLASVAELANCSVSTVSAVLAHRAGPWASDETRRRVFEAAAKIGYRPNLAARSLRGWATQTLGLITAALNVEITAAKVAAFEQAARDAGYVTMMTFSPNDHPEHEDRLITKLIDRSVDGLVVYPVEDRRHTELARLVRQRFPVVTIDGAGRCDLPCDDVSTDYRTAGRMQAEHLISLGRRRLAHVSTFPTCYTKDAVRAGFVEACVAAGLGQPTLIDLECSATMGSYISDGLCSQLRDRLERVRTQIDAVASYDLVASACARVALDIGIRVPADLAIIGFDGSPVAVNGAIPLTTVAQPAEQFGARTFELLQARMREPGRKGCTRILIKPELVVRASTSTAA